METRRPVKTRQVQFFQRLAKQLVNFGLTPNKVSLASVFFAIFSLVFMMLLKQKFILCAIITIICIQLRLICNLLDGLMAVEGGLKTATGEMFNDVPDRFSDIFFFVGVSTAIHSNWGTHIGWICALASVMTAYVRVLGASLGQGHDFKGPMAKQHRMFFLCLTLLSSIGEHIITGSPEISLIIGLMILALGTSITVFARLVRIANKINSQ